MKTILVVDDEPQIAGIARDYRNAQVFGLSDLGKIEPRKTADLLLLNADPLKSVEAWNNIESVIVNGL